MPSGETADQFVVAHGGKSHGSDAAALGTVGVSTKLAWRDFGGEVGRDRFGRPSEDALFRTGWRCGDLVDDDVVHVQLGKARSQQTEFIHDRDTLALRENLWIGCPTLRGE